jgi:hypothetical protein
MSEPVGWLRAIVVDADDPAALAAFWRAVLGVGVVEEMEDWVQLGVGSGRGRVYLAFEPSTEAAPAGRMRLRPDIEVEDMDVAQAAIEALGGRLVEIVQGSASTSRIFGVNVTPA